MVIEHSIEPRNRPCGVESLLDHYWRSGLGPPGLSTRRYHPLRPDRLIARFGDCTEQSTHVAEGRDTDRERCENVRTLARASGVPSKREGVGNISSTYSTGSTSLSTSIQLQFITPPAASFWPTGPGPVFRDGWGLFGPFWACRNVPANHRKFLILVENQALSR
jgi:hypothetical protein